MTPVNRGLPWPKPEVSNGQLDFCRDGALWRKVSVGPFPKKPWPTWGLGVTDLRHRPRNKSMVAGRLMRHAIYEATKMIRKLPCEHKIGMCRCPYERFYYYQEPHQRWQPWLLALLASTKTREGANMLEASLIFHFERTLENNPNNINWTTSCDYGGEGPTDEAEARTEHYVYLALRPIPDDTDGEPRLHQPIGDTSGLDVAHLGRMLAADGNADLAAALSAHLSEEEQLIASIVCRVHRTNPNFDWTTLVGGPAQSSAESAHS